MEDGNILGISEMTLKLVKLYALKMDISLPLNSDSLCTIYDDFYGQEVNYAMEAEEAKQQKGEWMAIEDKSSIFAKAADELSDFDESDNPDYRLLSKMINEVTIGPDGAIPEFI